MTYEFPPTLTEFAQDMDLEIHWDYDGPDEDAWQQGTQATPMVALSTQHEPSVGIFGGPITPWFKSEAELEDYCRKVAAGTFPTDELAEYIASTAEPEPPKPPTPIRDTSTAIVAIGDADKGGWFVWLVEFRGGNGDFKDGFGSYEAALEYARATHPGLEIFQRVYTPYDQEVEK